MKKELEEALANIDRTNYHKGSMIELIRRAVVLLIKYQLSKGQ